MTAIFFGVSIFLLAGNEGHAEAVILAGAFPINVWEAHSFVSFLFVFLFLLWLLIYLQPKVPFLATKVY